MTAAASTGPLHDLLRAEINGPVDVQILALTEKARALYGNNVCAVLFYGSCLRRGYQEDDVVDLYLIVEQYRRSPTSRLSALLNWVLPPNVIYLETMIGEKTVRAKCAIISLVDFERGVSGRWFHSYMWARFAQPCRISYVRDSDLMERLVAALEGAARTMVRETRPLMRTPFDSTALWERALTETYRAELRAERPGQSAELVRAYRDRYAIVSDKLCAAGLLDKQARDDSRYRASSTALQRLVIQFRWFTRRIAGKFLSVARLIKAAFTFDDGAVYILWKIERHSGVSIDLSDWQRRHPILASTTLFWRLYRKGAFK